MRSGFDDVSLRLVLHRLKLAAVLILTIVSAGQLILHNHSLIPEGRSPALACSVCAFSADNVSGAAPVLPVPLVVPFFFVVPEVVAAASAVPHMLPSRGPPPAA